MDNFYRRMRIYSAVMFLSFLLCFIMFIGQGCTTNKTSEYYDVSATDTNKGMVKISINAQQDSAMAFAPQRSKMFVYDDKIDDPVSDKDLYQVNMYVKKISVYSKGNTEYKIFEAESLVEGEITLRNNYTNRNNSGWTGDVAPGSYDRIEIEVEEVGVKYVDEYNDFHEWFSRSYNRKIILKGGTHFNTFTVDKKQEVSFKVNFYISGRVGKKEAEFAPNVYAIKDEE